MRELAGLKSTDNMSTLQQFIRFGTDAFGLERTLRGVQAIVQILHSYPVLLSLILYATSLGDPEAYTKHNSPKTDFILVAVRSQLGLARRYFRLFRFVDSFYGAHVLYTSLSSSAATSETGSKRTSFPTDVWLDIFARTFNGMYLLLEASTTVDALGISGLSVWGREWTILINIEAQRFWLFALVCGALSGCVKILSLYAMAPVPETGDGFGTGEKVDQEKVKARKEQALKHRQEVKAKSRGLLKKVVSDLLDTTIPGVIVGWMNIEPGLVGIAMLITTFITGKDVWDRCGREVRKA